MLTNAMEVASSYANDIDGVVWLVGILVGFWFFLAQAVFFGLIIKFRAKEGVRAQYITGETKEQMRWISWPHYLVLVCDLFVIYSAVSVWVKVKQDMPQTQETVRIISQQWAWTFVHAGPDNELGTDDDIRTVDELHVVADRTYKFELTSLDVLHSFSVPAFRLKQDAIPGRVINGWFKPIKTGTFDIQCSEICGIGHGIMAAQLHVETPVEHAAWMKTHLPAATAISAHAPGDAPVQEKKP